MKKVLYGLSLIILTLGGLSVSAQNIIDSEDDELAGLCFSCHERRFDLHLSHIRIQYLFGKDLIHKHSPFVILLQNTTKLIITQLSEKVQSIRAESTCTADKNML